MDVEKSPYQTILLLLDFHYCCASCAAWTLQYLVSLASMQTTGDAGMVQGRYVLIVEPGDSRWAVIGDFGELIRTLEWGCSAEILAAPPANTLSPFKIRGAKALEPAYEPSTSRTTSSQESKMASPCG
jgi:hypothetical protein